MNIPYTPASPCRCGYDGEGTHRCHAGRPDSETGEDGSRWCPEPAIDQLAATGGSLAGMQRKFSCVAVHYCRKHSLQAGFSTQTNAAPNAAKDAE